MQQGGGCAGRDRQRTGHQSLACGGAPRPHRTSCACVLPFAQQQLICNRPPPRSPVRAHSRGCSSSRRARLQQQSAAPDKPPQQEPAASPSPRRVAPAMHAPTCTLLAAPCSPWSGLDCAKLQLQHARGARPWTRCQRLDLAGDAVRPGGPGGRSRLFEPRSHRIARGRPGQAGFGRQSVMRPPLRRFWWPVGAGNPARS